MLVIVDTKQPPTNNTEMVPQVIVGAISIGIIGVIIVAMVIYMCCFKQKLNPNQRREQLMRKNKGECSTTLYRTLCTTVRMCGGSAALR